MPDTTTTTPDIGPGDLAATNSPFLLSTPDFIAVQTYVYAGGQLPTSRDAMQTKLGIDSSDVAQFDDLIGAYKTLSDHCTVFEKTTFPNSVNLASDIVHYNEKVPVYYGALSKVIADWDTLGDDKAQQELMAILTVLKTAAQGYATNAKSVRDEMVQFVLDTKSDESVLDPIKDRYKAKYTGQGGVIDTLLDEEKNDADQIKVWNDKYQHDVTVAATSATYAWVWPVGTIAAAIVAGIYGKKATDDLDTVHSYQDKLANAQTEVKKDLLLMHDLQLANDSIAGILASLQAALPVLEKMEGAWTAIASDLDNVITTLKEEIEDAPSIIKDLGVTDAINEWAAVATIAQAYRANAYIDVTTESAIKADSSKYALAA